MGPTRVEGAAGGVGVPPTSWLPALFLDVGSVGERSNFKKFPTHTQDHGDA